MDFDEINVIFIISNIYEDETQTSSIMRKAFALCNQNIKKTTWVREDDGESITFKKTDFVVFEHFKGELYEFCLKTRCTILGPRCLFTCLNRDIQIPNVDWPLLNLAMKDCSVVSSNLTKEVKKIIKEKVQTMGGIFTMSLVPTNTHLIADTVRSEKYTTCVARGVKIMLPSWVDALWTASQTEEEVFADDEFFAAHKCLPFQNLRISMTGFANGAEMKRLEKCIKDNGGLFSNRLILKCTDILVCNGSTSEKYKAARKHKIDCVSADWIFDSVEKGYAIPDVAQYAVKKGTSTPTKAGDFLDPNFSTISTISTMSSKSILQETMNNTVGFGLNSSTLGATPVSNAKRKSATKSDELVESIDIKRAKRAGPFLDGCCIYLAGFQLEDREKLCKVLNFSGATRYDTLSDRISHIVVGDATCHEVKIIRGKNVACPMVTVSWIIDSMNQQQPVPEEDYLISVESTSPGDNHGSPLVKKGLQLLKASVLQCSTTESKPEKEVPVDPLMDSEDLIMLQYIQQEKANAVQEEDTLAAVLAANNYDTKQHIENSKLNTPGTNTKQDETEAPSISMSTEETGVALFLNLQFMITHFDDEDVRQLRLCIENFGGTVVSPEYKGIIDYAVVPINSSPPLPQTVREVVTDIWVTECYEDRAIPPEVLFYHRPLLVNNEALYGTVIGVSGFMPLEKRFLKTICTHMGAVVQESLSRLKVDNKNLLPTTHLVSSEASGKKYDAAVKWNLFVVSKDWIVECARSGKRLDENNFTVGAENPDDPQEKSIRKVELRGSMSCSKPKLNISVHTPVLNNTPTNRTKVQNESPARTPRQENIENTESACTTPVNNISTYCSQITPVNQILKEANLEINKTPVTPKPWSHVDTPDSPIGAFICDPPPPELRKKLLRWINTFPEHKPKERRLSTPMSELKRRLWNKACPDYMPCALKYGDGSEQQPNSENEDLPSTPKITGGESDSQETPENKMVTEKLQQLHDVLLASRSSGSSRRSSIKRPLPIPMDSYPEKESQPFSVGWDEDMDIAMPKNKARFFMISGVDNNVRDDLAKQLETLGGHSLNLANYDPASTHLICEKLNRNEKLLGCMASGKWVLDLSYIRDSVLAGKFLNEEEYEFGNEKSKIKLAREDIQRAQCVHYWRKEISHRGYGAFHDIRALVISIKRDPLVRVIEAGGGMVIEASPPFTENLYATHCFMEVKAVENFKDYIPLAQQGIYCVNSIYVSEFLHKKVKDIQTYILPYFTEYY